ncbi:MAG: tRNA-specific adenosine deaminase [Clostridium sp. SCN 57-10]|nr:MAG: tRNA-specific adenosine deaminase [Clostridium sp. SCN 57-10]
MEREDYMREALALAREAAQDGEVPVGCVIVHDGRIVGRGRNTRERDRDALMHAEIAAIAEACLTLNGWRLTGCTLYVTLEPCPMCAGAIMNACISEVCYGASDTEWGACGGVLNLFEEAFPQRPRLYGGILAEESAALLRAFFQKLRKKY